MSIALPLALLAVLNVWASLRVARSDLPSGSRASLAAGIWVLPVLGVLIAMDKIRESAQRSGSSTPTPHPPMPGIVDSVAANQLTWVGIDVSRQSLDGAANATAIAAIVDPEQRAQAQQLWHRASLLKLRDTMGGQFRVYEDERALLLSSLDNDHLRGAVAFVSRTRERVGHLLNGIGLFSAAQKSIVIIMDDDDAYYDYVSNFYPDAGEYGFSGGMFVRQPMPHFVIKRAEWHVVEPTIAHEMSHSAVAHLPLPLWLNEGIAVNTERRLTGTPPSLHTVAELRAQHLAFWGEDEMQQFWSGESFSRPDDGQMLSYDLARAMVELMSGDWEAFRKFVNQARHEDAGASAAAEHLRVELGAYVCAMLERDPAKR